MLQVETKKYRRRSEERNSTRALPLQLIEFLSVLSASVVNILAKTLTTEARRTLRSYNDLGHYLT